MNLFEYERKRVLDTVKPYINFLAVQLVGRLVGIEFDEGKCYASK
jgi:hypothetical protein